MENPPKGWELATPLECYSSLNQLSFFDLVRWPFNWPKKQFYLQFSFNLHTPLKIDPRAYLIFHLRDATMAPSSPNRCYTIKSLTRWRLDIKNFQSMEDFLLKAKRRHRNSYAKSKKFFTEYGCSTTVMKGDWTKYVPEAYSLYAKIAERHGEWLYDLHFFKQIAKRPDYKLLAAWFQGTMIGMTVIQEEPPTFHSICGGLDYFHSSHCCAYSWLHYALIEEAIKAGQFQNVDVGLTADEAKNNIGFSPIPSCMDIYSNGKMTRAFLRTISPFTTATIDSKGKLNLSLSFCRSEHPKT